MSLHNRGLYRIYQGRYQKAREELDRLLEFHPGNRDAQSWISLSYTLEGRTDLALEQIRAALPGFPQIRFYEAMALVRAGQKEAALKLAGKLEKEYANGNASRQWFALVYAFLGDRDNTLQWLERSADRHERQAPGFAVHPAFAFLRGSARFEALRT